MNNALNIRVSVESARGCGYRKEGGYYFVMDKEHVLAPCGKMPIRLDVCPCCNEGIKFSRGGSWLNPAPFLKNKVCKIEGENCSCPLNNPLALGREEIRTAKDLKEAKIVQNDVKRIMPGIESLICCEKDGKYEIRGWYPHVYLLWVGKNFYKDFNTYYDEALRMGISRRIKTVPRNFVVGKTTVWLAHLNCIPNEDETMSPGVFFSFVPRVEYVVEQNAKEEDLLKIQNKGIQLVKVERASSEGSETLPIDCE